MAYHPQDSGPLKPHWGLREYLVASATIIGATIFGLILIAKIVTALQYGPQFTSYVDKSVRSYVTRDRF